MLKCGSREKKWDCAQEFYIWTGPDLFSLWFYYLRVHGRHIKFEELEITSLKDADQTHK